MNIEKFLDVLNNDPKAKALIERFEETAKQKNLVGDEYKKARETVVMMAIAFNQKLIHQMADEIFDDVNSK